MNTARDAEGYEETHILEAILQVMGAAIKKNIARGKNN